MTAEVGGLQMGDFEEQSGEAASLRMGISLQIVKRRSEKSGVTRGRMSQALYSLNTAIHLRTAWCATQSGASPSHPCKFPVLQGIYRENAIFRSDAGCGAPLKAAEIRHFSAKFPAHRTGNFQRRNSERICRYQGRDAQRSANSDHNCQRSGNRIFAG